MADRLEQVEQQLQEALPLLQQQHQHQWPMGVTFPNMFDDGDVVSWLHSFNVCAAANNWNDDARLRRLPTLLVGRAFAVFQSWEISRRTRWLIVASPLSQRFSLKSSVEHDILNSIRAR